MKATPTQDLDRYRADPVAFIDAFIPFNEKGLRWTLSPHQRRVITLAMREGRPPGIWIWGEMKKSGKTFVVACLLLWWTYTRPSTEAKVAANDLEQSQGRVFQTAVDLIKKNPHLRASATVRQSTIVLSNGTRITAIPNDYRGEAGSRHSIAVYDELWGYASESSQRLFEELTPPPTEQDAWILIGTYAGYTGESVLLERLYQEGLSGERIDTDLECYQHGRLFMFWSHTPRQPWQTSEYYAEQRRTLRPNAYLRLHENQWVTGSETFISAQQFDGCVDATHQPALERIDRGLFVGVDAGIKNDTAAVVAVYREGQRIVLAAHRIWRPTAADPLDIEDTIEAYLEDLRRRFRVRRILADPYQLHRSITSLRKRGCPIFEFPQTPANMTAAGQTLFELLNGRNLRLYPSDELRAQALNTVALESSRGWRIAKEKTTRKIDAITALAVACRNALDAPDGPSFGSAYMPHLDY